MFISFKFRWVKLLSHLSIFGWNMEYNRQYIVFEACRLGLWRETELVVFGRCFPVPRASWRAVHCCSSPSIRMQRLLYQNLWKNLFISIHFQCQNSRTPLVVEVIGPKSSKAHTQIPCITLTWMVCSHDIYWYKLNWIELSLIELNWFQGIWYLH